MPIKELPSLRILIIHNSGANEIPSGEAVVVNQEIESLRSRGHDVASHIVANRSLGNIRDVFSATNVFWSNRSYVSVWRLLQDFRPDIVHVHTILPTLTLSILHACRRAKVPVVQTLHNFRWFCVEGGLYRHGGYCDSCITHGALHGILNCCAKESFLASSLLTLNNKLGVSSGHLFSLVNRFIAVSNFTRDKFIAAGFPPHKIEVKYNGVVLPRTITNNDRHELTFVGRLSPSKGTDVLRRVLSEFTDMPINVIGNGSEFQALEAFCHENKLDNVTLWGKLEHSRVQEIVSNSSCILVPSRFAETFGLVAAESMALGTPVIASRIGALPELVGRSGGGILIDDPNDVQGFVSAIRYLFDFPSQRKEMGLRGVLFVKEHLAIEKTTDQLVDLYYSVR